MAISFVASQFYEQQANTTQQDVPIPSGAVAGDYVILQLQYLGGAANTPTGFTKQFDTGASSINRRCAIFSKKIADGETTIRLSFQSAAGFISAISVFRGVSSIDDVKSNIYNSGNAQQLVAPSAIPKSPNSVLFCIFDADHPVYSGSPAGLTEVYRRNETYWGRFLSGYRKSLSNTNATGNQTWSLSSSEYGNGSAVSMVLGSNVPPTLTLTSPSVNQTLTEGSDYPVEGSATEADAGNVVTVKFRINGGATLDAGTGTSDGATPITFSKNLVFQGDRLYDGSTDVSGILAEGTTHTLYVWAVDDQGGITAEQTRSFTVVYNAKPGTPTIVSPADTKRTPLRPVFEVTIGDDVENDSQHFILQLSTANDFSAGLQEFKTQTATAGWELHDGTQYVPFPGTGAASIFEGRNLRYTAQADLTENTTYYWRMAAVDATSGATGVWTPTRSIRAGNVLQWAIDPKVTDAPARRVVLNLIKNIATDGTVPAQLTVKVANNALDVSPAWEDATAAFLAGEYYDFTNAAKTAAQWAVGIEITVQANDSLGAIEVDADGYSFD